MNKQLAVSNLNNVSQKDVEGLSGEGVYGAYLNLLLFSALVSLLLLLNSERPVQVLTVTDNANARLERPLATSESDTSLDWLPLYERVLKQSESYSKEYDVRVVKGQNGFAVHISVGAVFKPGDAELQSDHLEKMVEMMQGLRLETQDVYVEVVGYTDSSPVIKNRHNYQTNWELSAARAARIARMLLDSGMPKERLKVAGRADAVSFSVRTPATEGQYQRMLLDRRVVIYVSTSPHATEAP